jgi:soluble lytic murein transglycosylase
MARMTPAQAKARPPSSKPPKRTPPHQSPRKGSGLKWLVASAITAGLALAVHAEIKLPEFMASSSVEMVSTQQTSADFDSDLIVGKTSIALRSQSLLASRPSSEKEAFLKALEHYKNRKIEEGDVSAREVKDPTLKVVLNWLAVRSGGADFERVITFLRQNPDWPSAASIRKRAEEALLSEKLPPATVRLFFAARRPQTPVGKFALAMAFKQDQAHADAALLVRDAWRSDPFSLERESKVLETFPDVLTPLDHRARMELHLLREDWPAALISAGRAGAGYEGLVKARKAVIGKTKNAKEALEAVPLALRTDSSYALSQAIFLRQHDKWVEAAQAMANVSRDPRILIGGDDWWEERRLIARQLLERKEPKWAYAVVSHHGAESNIAKLDAEFHSGWIALRFLNEPATAARHFALASRIAETPISIARASYWEGRAAEAMGQVAEANRFYGIAGGHRITYYGQLARARMGRFDLPLRPVPGIETVSLSRLQNNPAIEAIRILQENDHPSLALSLFREMAQTLSTASEVAALGDIARRDKNAKATLILGKTAVQRGFPLDIHAYPTFGVPKIDLSFEGVDKSIVHAIARQESEFDPEARSHVGARGLMQMMPATARETARKIGKPFEVNKLTDDPTYNATLGAAHLSELLKEWNGSYILTFAAYNAGSGNVRKWMKAYGDPRTSGVDPVDWVERIPFSETRDYVQRVMENMQVYRQRFGEKTNTPHRGANAEGALRSEVNLRSDTRTHRSQCN